MHKHQKGFTLIELLIAIAIVGLITGGITGAIIQVLTINTRASNRMIAVRQVQQAGKEVSKDTLQAQSVDPTEGGGEYPPDTDFPLSLNWTDLDEQVNVVVYTLEDMPSDPDLKVLKRSHTINGVPQMTGLIVVAQYIDVTIDPATGKAKTNCDWDPDNWVLTLTVTATVGNGPQGASETRIYQVEPRPTAPE